MAASVSASNPDDMQALKTEVERLKSKVENLENKKSRKEKGKKQGIEIGGAVRYQFTWSEFDKDNSDRAGDLDFNLFRLDLDGEVDNIILSAQYRWYDYMNVVHHAWIGYEFSDKQTLKFGIQEVPFGNFPRSANSFFYSTAYFVGLQADFDTGLNWTYEDKRYRVDVGYYPNDELGGVDGWVEDRKDRYSFDVVGLRLEGESIFADPSAELGESNTINARFSRKYTIAPKFNIEPGVSYQQGNLSQDGSWNSIEALGNEATKVGEHSSWAAHLNIDWQAFNFQFQFASYENTIKNYDAKQFVVGSFNFYGSIPATADTWLTNIAWEKAVNFGPIKKIRLFNDYSRLTNKSDGSDPTWMNSTGMIVSAGPLYTYIELFRAKNQPFVGGSLVRNDSEDKQRLNINIGYYF